MRIRVSLFLSVLCMLALSAPVWAKSLSTNFDCIHAKQLVGKQLKPGNYRFVANESTGGMKVMRNGQVVAQVHGQWVNLQKKPPYGEVLTTRNDIQEVRFSGQKRALKFPTS